MRNVAESHILWAAGKVMDQEWQAEVCVLLLDGDDAGARSYVELQIDEGFRRKKISSEVASLLYLIQSC